MFRILGLFLALGIASAALPPGRALPDALLSMPGGKLVPLKQYRGKPILLVIFSTTCKDCEEAINLLDKIQPEYAPRGLQIIAASVEPDAGKMVSTWIINNKKRYPVGYFELDPYRKVADIKPNQAAHVPILLFIDAKGFVRVQFFGDDTLMKNMEHTVRSVLTELMKEPR